VFDAATAAEKSTTVDMHNTKSIQTKF